MKRYFVTGTDTDCGKTYVTQQLINHYEHSLALKPIASGCQRIGSQLVSSDAQLLMHHPQVSLEQINPWRYALPVSPHIAAEHEKQEINLTEVLQYCLEFELNGLDRLFIEGAGGLFVPLNKQSTWLDFLVMSQIPVVFVVGMKLGCINHAALSLLALQVHGIECVGWIANCIDPNMLALEENISTLKSMLQPPLLAIIPYGQTIQIKTHQL